MRRYKHLITKMKFPVSTIPTFVGMSKFVIHLLLFAIVIVIYFLFGEPFTLYYLQLPIYMLLMFLFCVGWTLFGSVLAAISQDFANLVKSFTTALFWLSGIMWPVNKITNHGSAERTSSTSRCLRDSTSHTSGLTARSTDR